MIRVNLPPDMVKDLFQEKFRPDYYDPDAFWMVFWVGKFFRSLDNNLMFKTVLIRIQQKELGKISYSSLDFSDVRIMDFPVSMCPILPLGTIFQKGIFQKDIYKHIPLFDVKISEPFIDSIKLKEWYLGPELHQKLGLNKVGKRVRNKYDNLSETFGLDSRISVVNNYSESVDAKYIIYPIYEVARFNWFPSTTMTFAMLEPSKVSSKKDVLFDRSSLRLPTDDFPFHYLKIRNEMKVSDVARIARIAFEDRARNSALKIIESHRNSIIMGHSEGFYIDTFFPFKDSEQKVLGIIIRLKEVNVLLVLQTLECSSSFPFEVLRYDRETPQNERDSNLPPEDGVGFNPDNNDKGETDKTPRVIYNYDPVFGSNTTKFSKPKNDKKINDAKHIVYKNSYSNLTKNIKKLRETQIVGSKKENVKYIRTSNISTNQNKESNTNSTGLEIITKEGDTRKIIAIDIGDYSDLIKFIVDYLKSIGATVKYHNLIDDNGQDDFNFITLDPTLFDIENFEKDSHGFLKMNDNIYRRLIAISVNMGNGKHFLLLQLEPQGKNAFWAFTKKSHKSISSSEYVSLNKNDLMVLLQKFVEGEGRFNNLPDLIERKKFHHETKSPKDHILRVLKVLKF